jgi:hypothetical protein
MSISRANLGRGPAHVTIGGATLFTRDDLVPRHAPEWQPVESSMHGQTNKYKSDFTVKLALTLFGIWDNLGVLFPSALLNPVVGTSLFGTTDQAVVIHARNGDRLTYHNAQITKLGDLYLGVDSELFAAAVEVTAILKNNANPEDANSVFTRDTAAYTDAAFAMTNFKKCRWSGAWTGKTGLTSFVGQKGFNVAWQLDLQPEKPDGHGTVDMYIGKGGLVAGCKCVPIGPSMPQIDTAQNVHAAHGTLLSAGAADLTLTGTGASVVLKAAAMTESGTAFGVQPLRVGEVAWETTRSVAAGVASAVATVA